MGCIAQGRLQILWLEIGKFAEDLIRGEPSGIEIEHITHADPHPSDAGFSAALGGVVGDVGLTHDNTLAAPACPLKPPTPSPLTTPPGSRAPAATEIPPRHRALTLVAFVAGKPQTQEGFGGGAGAAILFALLAHVAAGFRAAVQQHP